MTVDVNEFMDHLKDNNLVIVSKNDYENGVNVQMAKTKALHKKLLNKSALSLYEVIKHKLTNYTSIEGLAASKEVKPGEIFINNKGTRMIVASAILRIRNNKHL